MPELVTVTTDDDCLLDGAYWPGNDAAVERTATRADACLLIHGATSNAFSPLQRTIAQALAEAGVAVLSLSTRGHDVVSRLHRPDALEYGGVAFEDLDDAPRDLHAGVRWLQAQGHQRVML
ncbi:MAG: hypothetical protein O7H39_04590, partial [Gammaproteobacteria bacterium]|nr:hypothetical protein [Gammaproteobacteria bacterium]